jgi:UDP-GlcNAc:undecaprenyl-phosphate GlcNAc-1-phosphate transferase
MLERIVQRRPVFVADKNHLHHKLMKVGLFHTEAVVVVYVLQACLVTSAFAFRFYSEWFLISLYLVFSGAILFLFFVADNTGLQIKRYDFVDQAIKGKLRLLKERLVLIRAAFRIVEFGVPLLVLFSCFLPAAVPGYLSFLSLGLGILIVAIWLSKKEWMAGAVRVALYLLTPFVIYFSEVNMVPWMKGQGVHTYNLLFGVLIGFVIVTLKFTRRKKGFKSTPMDFLILFIALVVPHLPDQQIRSYGMGLVAAKIIVLFFSCEVLIGELRGNLSRLAIGGLASLTVLGVRGIM